MTNPIILIDAGHGGKDPKTGEYVTAPGKMHTFSDGLTVYEGVVNRLIAAKVRNILLERGYEVHKAHHPWQDTSLWDRVNYERTLRERDGHDTIFVSIHNNAGGGQGMEAFNFPGSEEGQRLNRCIYNGFAQQMPGYNRRPNWNDGKEAEFYVLQHTYGPAVLVECGFMDNRHDAELMLSESGQYSYAKSIIYGIEKYFAQ